MPEAPHVLSVGDLRVALHERRAFFGDAELVLTSREFDVLAALAEGPGCVLTARQLAEAENRCDSASPEAVNVHISHLRTKLSDAGAINPIETVRGIGWRLRRPTRDPYARPLEVRQFVGRVTELTTLERVLEPGVGRFVLVRGEPGIGKTALVERLISSTAPRFEVIRAICDGNGSGDYWLWRQLLNELERRRGPLMDEVSDGHLLSRLAGNMAPSIGPLQGADRALAFDAVGRYVGASALVGTRPLLLFIDDLQWADDASLKLLAHTLKRLASIPCGMVAACRESDALVREALRPVVDFAAQRREAASIALGGLSESDVSLLIESAEMSSNDRSLPLNLWEHTEGNPLFLIECLRALDNSVCTSDDLEHIVASSISVLVRDQIASLPARTQTLLRFAAVSGAEFDPRTLAEAAGYADDAEWEESALTAAILVRGREHSLAFRHTLVRAALLEGMSPGEREAVNRSVADALRRVSLAGDRRAFRLAHHYSLAGPGARKEAIGYLLAAARISSARFAVEDTASYLEEALGLLGSAGLPQRPERRLHSVILERLGIAHSVLGDSARTIALYQEALATRPSEDISAQIRLHTRLGAALMTRRQGGQCFDAFTRALTTLNLLHPRNDAWWRRWIEIRLGQAEAAMVLGVSLPFEGFREELEARVDMHGTPEQRAKYYIALADRLSMDERWRASDESIAAGRRAVAAARTGCSEHVRAYATSALGNQLLAAGMTAEAEGWLRESLDLTTRCADVIGMQAALFMLTRCARVTDDVRSTEARALELKRMTRERATMPEFVCSAWGHLGWVALRRGRISEAAGHSERALATWLRQPACSQSVWIMAWPAVSCALAANDVTRALECAALMTRFDQEALRGELDTRLAEALRLHLHGDVESARDLLIALEVEARSYGYA